MMTEDWDAFAPLVLLANGDAALEDRVLLDLETAEARHRYLQAVDAGLRGRVPIGLEPWTLGDTLEQGR